MSGVSVGQSCGISAGLSVGHDFALKNGFYPMSGRGWRLGSTGVIRDDHGGTYAMTVMTEGSSTEAADIALVELVTAHVNDRLTIGDATSRSVDAVSCNETSDGASWAAAASTLGVSDVANLRHINGGEAAPLSGQRVCAPLVGAS